MSATNAQGKNVVRMSREDILKLKDSIASDLRKRVEDLKKAYPSLAHTAFESLDEIIRAIDEYEENERTCGESAEVPPSQENEQPQPQEEEGEQQPPQEEGDTAAVPRRA